MVSHRIFTGLHLTHHTPAPEGAGDAIMDTPFQSSDPSLSLPALHSCSPSVPSESSSSVLSKRSQDVQSDNECDSQASSQKHGHHKVKAHIVKNKLGVRSAPAEDSQFLTTEGSTSRSRSNRRLHSRQGFMGDDTESVGAFGIGVLDLSNRDKNIKGGKKGKGTKR